MGEKTSDEENSKKGGSVTMTENTKMGEKISDEENAKINRLKSQKRRQIMKTL